MYPNRMIVIGTSAGGVQALKSLVELLPPDFPAPIFIAMHLKPESTSHLPNLINHYSQLVALHPIDGQTFKAGCIYVAPPNLHMIISENKIYLRYGPEINFCRPAIDPLFYSVAINYGASVIGILLTGVLNDGTAGLLAIKENKGITIIQDLKEAEYPEMPRNALKNVSIDYCLVIKDIASLLIDIVSN